MFETETNTLEVNNTIADTANNDAYGLESSTASEPTISYLRGGLGADTFTIDSSFDVNIISGNGNIDLGVGYYDILDLSSISVDEVVNYSLAQVDEGGIVFDVGNGERVFDYMELADGTEILFEGLDGVIFSDEVVDLTINPNDTSYAMQWNLHMMGVQNAWRFTTGSEDVLIGVQDNGLGVDYYGNIHPDLRDNTFYIEGNVSDEFFRNVPGDSYDRNGSHGTSVQGIIAAEANNEMGIAGINWNSDVFNIDLDIDENTGDLNIVEATQAMIDLADSQGQNLAINMSISYYDPNFEAIVADNPDVLFVIASGNGAENGEGIASPAILARDYDNVMAVGASWGYLDESGFAVDLGTRADYSQHGEGLTLMGPTAVVTTDAIPGLGFDYNYVFNGTSAATPNVTGVASLVWSVNQDLTPAEIKSILSDTAYDLGDVGYDLVYGSGLVNADAAVRRAIALKTTAEVTPEIDESPVEDIPVIIPEIADIIDSIALDSNDSTTENEPVVTPLELPQSDATETTTTNLFDYAAAGMSEIIEMNHQDLQAELLSDSPLYSELVVSL